MLHAEGYGAKHHAFRIVRMRKVQIDKKCYHQRILLNLMSVMLTLIYFQSVIATTPKN
jgi:hypothetical protein